MVQKILFCLLATSLISSVFSIYLQTKSYKNLYCSTKQIENEDTIKLSYLITGDSDDEKVDVYLYDSDNNILFQKVGESGGEFHHKITKAGTYKLCFNVPKPGENYISFEYFTEYEKGHTLDMAKDRKYFYFYIF